MSADKYEEHACDFKDEEECEEELEEDGIEKIEAEVEHFDEKKDLQSGSEEPAGEE